MMNEMVMKLKDKILDELMNDLDDHESEKLRPSVSPAEAMDSSDPSGDSDGMPMTGGGEDDDDELRAALERYGRD